MGPRPLTDEELAHFSARGFVIARGVLRDADFAGFERDYGAMVDAKAEALEELGLVAASSRGATPFRRRLAAVAEQLDDAAFEAHLKPFGDECDCAASRVAYQTVRRQMRSRARLGRIDAAATRIVAEPGRVHAAATTRLVHAGMHARVRGFHDLLYAPRLLDAAESLVGPEVTLNPIQHVRPFLPRKSGPHRNAGVATMTPWHQDVVLAAREVDVPPIHA